MRLQNKDLHAAMERALRWKRLRALHRDQIERTTERATQSVEASSAAFLTGLAQGIALKHTGRGIPYHAEFLAGLLLTLAGYADLAGRSSTHLNGFGNGFLGAYLATLGYGVGKE